MNPYCPRCAWHVADKQDVDGTAVCRECRGHAHELVEGSTLCKQCRARTWREREVITFWQEEDDDCFEPETRIGGPFDEAPDADTLAISLADRSRHEHST